ncbi:hypothetical protein P5G65_01580 [Paenibacillus chondroitinus]|uniref:Uncharacterized protein n=1 Tax=Paenibacillus chondroitinus TaxID=59842 RepID=A0ABU6D6M2_9BACL|nr:MULTISPECIES: hypothetical protein [Paenibacillus]MCY9658429.1 hypothetical protein [Paenibacillus anseongense]MEB4792572.1 hypothetical protein [Paenibacillus chondroitinus]
MEQLIVFLFKHWYLVIIAITFLYQLQNKGRRASQKGQRMGMPTFGESPGQAQRRPEARELERRGNAPSEPSGALRDELRRPSASQDATSNPKTKVSPFSSPKQAEIGGSSVYAGDLTAPAPFPESPNQDQLLQGVVWSEILGPPRSKKPYRR